MKTIKSELTKWNHIQKDTQGIKGNSKRKRKNIKPKGDIEHSDSFWREMMNTNKPTYSRGKGGALKQK